MARKTFFSFHYQPDVSRAFVVRNAWVTQGREDAGFFDSSVFEAKKRESPDALKRFLREGIDGTSVTCVLYGTQTAWRPWVRYELVRSFIHGSGIFAIDIHDIQNLQRQTEAAGPNPLECLAFKVDGDRLRFYEKMDDSDNGWREYTDAPAMALTDVAYDLGGKAWHTFGTVFHSYSWNSDAGYTNIGNWIEFAARGAGR